MISIIVERAPGDKQGKNITDSLVTSVAQAQQLGRASIDDTCSDRFTVSGTMPMAPYMEPGKIVQVSDLQKGSYNGMLLSSSISISKQSNGDFSATTSVTIERKV